MSLINKLQEDQLTARKAKDKFATKVLSTLYAECQMVGLNDGKRETTDAEVVKVIQKFIKNIEESLSLVTDNDKKVEMSEELGIYISYLPTQLNEHDLNKIVENIIYVGSFSGPRDMGNVMKVLKESYGGAYDGKIAAAVVKRHLG